MIDLNYCKKLHKNKILKYKKVKFGEVARRANEIISSPESCGLQRYVAGEHMQTDNFRINNWGTIEEGYLGPAFNHKFCKGQILYGSRRTYLRKISIPHFDGICANTTFVIEPTGKGIIPQLLPFIMQSTSFTNNSIKMSRGSTNPYITWKDIAEFEFIAPDDENQPGISKLLWAIEDCIIKGEKLLLITNRLKKALVKELFSKGIYHKEFIKNDKIGLLPKDWNYTSLGNEDLFILKTGGTPSTDKKEYWDGDIPWLLSGEVNNKHIRSTEKKITNIGYERSNATWIPKKSVLIALAGQGKTRGTVAITEIDLTVNQSIAAIIPNTDKILPEYLYHKLDSMYEFLRNYSGGSNRGGLSLSSIRDIHISYPDIFEQSQIANILTHCDNVIESTLCNITNAKSIKMDLINFYFSGDDHGV